MEAVPRCERIVAVIAESEMASPEGCGPESETWTHGETLVMVEPLIAGSQVLTFSLRVVRTDRHLNVIGTLAAMLDSKSSDMTREMAYARYDMESCDGSDALTEVTDASSVFEMGCYSRVRLEMLQLRED